MGIKRETVRLANLIKERIQRNCSVRGVSNRGTNQPHGSSVVTAEIYLSFLRTSNGLKIVVEFVGGLNDRRSVQVLAVRLIQHIVNARARTVRHSWVLREPEVGVDPHAQQIVTEVAVRSVVRD